MGDGSERDDGGGEGTESGGSSAILSSSSISTLYLSDDCIGAVSNVYTVHSTFTLLNIFLVYTMYIKCIFMYMYTA